VARKPVKPAKPSRPVPKKAKAPAKPAPKPAKKAAVKPAPKAKAPAPKKSATQKAVAAVKTAAAAVVAKAAKPVKAALKSAAVAAAVAAPVAKQQAKSAIRNEAAPKPAPSLRPPAPAKAPRRPRTRIPTSDGGPLAAWIRVGEQRRPSSFIPAPPRAESPSQIAAAPASSDRLIRPDDLQDLSLPAIRTFPIRVEVEQSVGRTHILVQPSSVTITAGDGVEWDFRYLVGADTFIDEIIVDFGQTCYFGAKSLKSRNPGSARPHRQLSGRLAEGAPKGTLNYTIRCQAFGTEIAKTTAEIIVA
jgi:hypothetical protein